MIIGIVIELISYICGISAKNCIVIAICSILIGIVILSKDLKKDKGFISLLTIVFWGRVFIGGAESIYYVPFAILFTILWIYILIREKHPRKKNLAPISKYENDLPKYMKKFNKINIGLSMIILCLIIYSFWLIPYDKLR